VWYICQNKVAVKFNIIISSIYKFGLSVCLYPINFKTAEAIGHKFLVGHHVTTGKVYEWSKFQIFVSIKIRSSLNFGKFWKSTKFFVKIRELFLFCFTMYTKRTCSQLIWKMGAKRPLILPCCGGGGEVPKTTLGKRVGEKKENWGLLGAAESNRWKSFHK